MFGSFHDGLRLYASSLNDLERSELIGNLVTLLKVHTSSDDIRTYLIENGSEWIPLEVDLKRELSEFIGELSGM